MAARSGHAQMTAHLSKARSRGAVPVDRKTPKPKPKTNRNNNNQRAGGPNAYDEGAYVGGYN
jgi:hypothetical protein